MKEEINRLSHIVIGRAIEVHKELGPGLLESAYEECLAHEFKLASLTFERQKPIPVKYKTLTLECGYRLDFLVEDKLVIELKSVEALVPLFEAQILTYMRLADKPLGLLINFNEHLLKDGLKRFIR
jgi:GxxExxY protein